MLKAIVKKAINAAGYDIVARPHRVETKRKISARFDKIHYACGHVYMPGWMNVDIKDSGPENYACVDLIGRHPFKNDSFRFAFSEDFIEHIAQAEAIVFLSEVYRTLKPGGVFRLSTPGLEQILRLRFTGKDFDSIISSKHEAFDRSGHRHMFSNETLAAVAKHIGFSVAFVDFGKSRHQELCDLDTRANQTEINIHAELTKPHVM